MMMEIHIVFLFSLLQKIRDKMERNQIELNKTMKEKEALACEIKTLQNQLANASADQSQYSKEAVAASSKEIQEINARYSNEINKLKQLLNKSESDLQKTLGENNR